MKFVYVSLRRALCIGTAFGLLTSAGAGELKYLISLKPGGPTAGIEATINSAGGKVTGKIPQIGILVASSAAADFPARIARSAKVEAVVPDVMLNFLAGLERSIRPGPMDAMEPPQAYPDYSFLQWGLTAIDAPGAWAKGAKGKGALVAVLDTGIVLEHPDLAGQFLPEPISRSFVYFEPLAFNDTAGSFSHGTHVAGIVAANDNGKGVVGVAPEAKLLFCKVLTDEGWGSFEWLLYAIVYATDSGADIINMSLAGLLPRRGFVDNRGTEDPTDDVYIGAVQVAQLFHIVNRATQYAYQRGATLIAAASNEAIDRNHDADLIIIPADCMNVIQVSATGPVDWLPSHPDVFLDYLAVYSNYGQSRIDFAAPGGNADVERMMSDPKYNWVPNLVVSSCNGTAGWWAYASGTSMAAPHVSGVAALIIGQNGKMSPASLEAALRASADDLGKPGKDAAYGQGRVNAAKAVK